MKKNIKLLFIGLLATSVQHVYADCNVVAREAVFGPLSSFNVQNNPTQQIAGGLFCDGSLSVVATSYIKYRASFVPIELVHTNGVNKARIEIKDQNGNVLANGKEADLTTTSLFSIFGGPSSSIPFTVTLAGSTSLKPGIYKGHLRVTWYYYVPGLGGFGVNLFVYQSPGFTLGGVFSSLNWGSGVDVDIPITLIIREDCRINANDISFGSAALISNFSTVNGTVHITCSADTPYSVGLSDGQNFKKTRRMKHQSQASYIAYDVYKNTSSQRWGDIGFERWNSTEASARPGIHDGVTRQTYNFSSKITEPSAMIAPEGVYSDTVQIEVKF